MAALQSVRLEGRRVVLDPLSLGDTAALFAAADDVEMFRFLSEPLRTVEHHAGYVQRALDEQAAGRALPFCIRLRESGEVIGSTRFAAYDPAHHRAEIGWTWIARKVQRSAVNSECKRLLLAHGFDTLGLNRIEFKTDFLNTVSRTAIARLGATQEGVFRQHMVMPDGRVRDTVYFSIVREEWPAVRARLDGFLSASANSARALTS